MAASGRAAGRPSRRNLVAILSIVVLSGAFFGYDQGVISGALHDIRRTFDVGTFEVEEAASWVTVGALAGALAGGHLADRAGRRGALWVAGGAYVVAAIVQAAAPTIGALLGARVLLGVGIGVASVAGPMFAAEAAPERVRGGLLGVYQFSITFAIFIGYLADELFTGGDSWRYLLDRVGRRPLLLVGLAGMAVSLAVVSVSFLSAGAGAGRGEGRVTTAGLFLLVGVIFFVAFYAVSIGPAAWTVINEIYPGPIRGRCVAIATATHWGTEYLITQFFLSLLDALGRSGVCALFAGLCVLGFLFVRRYLPETRGRTLEQIQQMWVADYDRRERAHTNP